MSFLLAATSCIVRNGFPKSAQRLAGSTVVISNRTRWMFGTMQQSNEYTTGRTQRPSTAIEVDIGKIEQISPTTKLFQFHRKPGSQNTFHFKAGQWAEVYLERSRLSQECCSEASSNNNSSTSKDPAIAGFSMTSSPCLWENEGVVEFAIKRSPHPVVCFLHEQAREGDQLHLDGGHGTLFFDPEGPNAQSIVLVGGGIGITPLTSIMRQAYRTREVALVHSVTSPSELVFAGEFEAIQAANPDRIRYIPTVSTQSCSSTHPPLPSSSSSSTSPSSLQWKGRKGRVDEGLLAQAVEGMRNPPLFFLCGPMPMVRDVSEMLQQMKVDPSHIIYEKW